MEYLSHLMLLRPLKPWHLLLLIPYALVSGLAYGLVAQWLVRDREPWFTLLMLGGLGLTISFFAWLGGIPLEVASWTFAGTGSLYVLFRLVFGRGSASEMLALPQILAVLILIFWGGWHHARQKVLERQQQRSSLEAP